MARMTLQGEHERGALQARGGGGGGNARAGSAGPTRMVPATLCGPPTELRLRSSEGRVRLRISTELAVRYSEGRVRLRISTELPLRPGEGRVRLRIQPAGARTAAFDPRLATAASRLPTLDIRRSNSGVRLAASVSATPRRRASPPPPRAATPAARSADAAAPTAARPVQPDLLGSRACGALPLATDARPFASTCGWRCGRPRPRPAAGRAERRSTPTGPGADAPVVRRSPPRKRPPPADPPPRSPRPRPAARGAPVPPGQRPCRPRSASAA